MSDSEDAFKRWEKTIQDGIDEWKKTILEAFAELEDRAERRHDEAMTLAEQLHVEATEAVTLARDLHAKVMAMAAAVAASPAPSDELPSLPALQIGDPIEVWLKRPGDELGDWCLAQVRTISAGATWAKVEVFDDYGARMRKIWLARDRDPPWRRTT